MKPSKSISLIIFFSFIAILSSYLKISFGLGSYKFFFSGINFILPTLGSFLGTTVGTIFIPLFFIFKKMTLGGALSFGIPTFISSLFFSLAIKNDSNKDCLVRIGKFVLSVIIPLFCMILFILHPVGSSAYLYSFYWFIPVVLYCLDKFEIWKSIFSVSLTTTFIAHAVGSLIWLYAFEMSAIQWLNLIPLVAIERLVFANGIAITHAVFYKLFLYFQSTLQLSLGQRPQVRE